MDVQDSQRSSPLYPVHGVSTDCGDQLWLRNLSTHSLSGKSE